MTAFADMNAREKILVCVLGAALILGGYLFTRGAYLQKQVLILEDQQQSMEKKVTREKKKYKDLELPELNGKKIRSKDIKKLEKMVEQEKALLSGFGHVFVDLRDKSKLAKLQAEIHHHAEKNNLQLLSKIQSEVNLIEIISKNKSSAPSTSLNRPLYDLHLQGGYSALHGFIQQLTKLEYSVVPIKMQVNRTNRTAIGGGRVLEVQLTLAL